jgi:hypothetical protein
MEMPFSDVCDRYTITKLKLEHSNTDHHKSLFELYSNEIGTTLSKLNPVQREKLTVYLNVLYYANSLVWNAESEIRQAIDDDLPADEYKWRTIHVKEGNALRIEYRNKIAEIAKEPVFKEIKFNHGSGVSG